MLSIKARTATITLRDEYCLKVLNHERDLKADLAPIARVARIMAGGQKHDGWCYRAVELHEVNENDRTIKMDRASGKQMNRALSRNFAFHAGVWLGLFHNGTRNEENRLFGDYGPAHCFMDEKARVFTVIDPSDKYGETNEVVELDVGDMLSKMTRLAIGRRLNPVPLGKTFLAGYSSVGTSVLVASQILDSVMREREKNHTRWVRGESGHRLWAAKIYARIDMKVVMSAASRIV